MNYIKKLQDELIEKQRTVDGFEKLIRELKIYLSSDKFRNDTTVQVADVFHRINEGLTFYVYQD